MAGFQTNQTTETIRPPSTSKDRRGIPCGCPGGGQARGLPLRRLGLSDRVTRFLLGITVKRPRRVPGFLGFLGLSVLRL
jgi:hypothetical protein